MVKKSGIPFLVLLITIIFSSNINAQVAGINFSLAFPRGEFAQQVDKAGIGLSGELLFLSPRPGFPFGLGVNIGYYVYGSESRKEPWNLTIPDVYVDVNRTNNLLNFHMVLELGLPTGNVRPYLQALVGGTYLYTQTTVSGEYNQQDIASTTNYYDWAWSYGAGGGLSILLSGDPTTMIGAVYLDLKARYLYGSEATYLKEGGVEIIGSRVYYHPSKSKTDILTAHLGVRIALSLFNN